MKRRATLIACLLAAGGAVAQKLPPSAAELAAAAVPVRVVCVADTPEQFLRDDAFRERVLLRLAEPGSDGAAPDPRTAIRPLGVRYVVPMGAGFVVDADRRHVVTSWQVVTACAGERGSGRQAAVLEPGNPNGAPLLGERLPDRQFLDANGQPVLLVQALCRQTGTPCDVDLPHGPDRKPVAAAERRRQLDNLLAYAPDLAVLRLATVATTPPLALALNQQLDDQMRLYVRGFGRGADALLPASVPALYTGPQQYSSRAADGAPDGVVHARLHRLAMPVQPAAAGAPVLRADGVVGVLTVMMDVGASASDASGLGTSHAVPVQVLASFLTLLKVPFQTAALELPPRADTAPAAAPAPAPDGGGSYESRRWMIIAAAVIALGAAGAFFALARRQRRVAAVVPPPPMAPRPVSPQAGQRTTTRRPTTVLHAVAMPTAAVEPVPQDLPAVNLRCSAGPLADATYSLPMPNGGCTLFVGRDAKSCQVVLPAAADDVSAVHACFTWDPHAALLTLRDLSSSGTWVNGQRIEKGRTVTLAQGDRVELGGPDHNRFTVDLPAASTDEEPTR
ncbi:MAG: FHA domain-containing protein [Rubrivivax sp.]